MSVEVGYLSEWFGVNPMEQDKNNRDMEVLDISDKEWSYMSQKIAQWLVTLHHLEGMS